MGFVMTVDVNSEKDSARERSAFRSIADGCSGLLQRTLSSALAKQAVKNQRAHFLCLSLATVLLASCATPPLPPPPAPAPQYWSVSRNVSSDSSMVTLFDPTDLAHHQTDPEGWHRYDFAFASDLESGRFAAVYTDIVGNHRVRLTKGPLTDEEKLAAGPDAVLRLRVINRRLLLAGGDTWPSNVQGAYSHALDPRWIDIDNGDYRVVITALERQLGARHDIVIQLIPEEDMIAVSYAPGIPYLVPGELARVKGVGAGGLRYQESCGDVRRTATWSPLSSVNLPLPGTVSTMDIASSLYQRGSQLQTANRNAAVPILVARNPTPGTVGLFIEPDTWQPDAVAVNGEIPVTTRVLCAVRIRSVVADVEGFELELDPLIAPIDRLSHETSQRLTRTFDNWIRLSGDPAWRFKSAQIKRTRGQRAVFLGIMENLSLSAKHTESLLLETNKGLAKRLIEHMDREYAEVEQ